MKLNDMTLLVKSYIKLKEAADLMMPGIDHDGTVLGVYCDLAEVIANNLGDKYGKDISSDNGWDAMLDVLDGDMSYEEKARELLK